MNFFSIFQSFQFPFVFLLFLYFNWSHPLWAVVRCVVEATTYNYMVSIIHNQISLSFGLIPPLYSYEEHCSWRKIYEKSLWPSSSNKTSPLLLGLQPSNLLQGLHECKINFSVAGARKTSVRLICDGWFHINTGYWSCLFPFYSCIKERIWEQFLFSLYTGLFFHWSHSQ